MSQSLEEELELADAVSFEPLAELDLEDEESDEDEDESDEDDDEESEDDGDEDSELEPEPFDEDLLDDLFDDRLSFL